MQPPAKPEKEAKGKDDNDRRRLPALNRAWLCWAKPVSSSRGSSHQACTPIGRGLAGFR